MTRQKKEIIRKIQELDRELAIDEALSFGCAPDGAYDVFYDAINKLQEELAHLCHFDTYIDYVMDPRWRVGMEDLPFT